MQLHLTATNSRRQANSAVMHATTCVACFVSSQPMPSILSVGRSSKLLETTVRRYHPRPNFPSASRRQKVYQQPRTQLSPSLVTAADATLDRFENVTTEQSDILSGSKFVSKRDDHDISIETESLNLLEWKEITARVLQFATTDLGRAALINTNIPEHLYLPATREESEQLLQQTREIRHLEHVITFPLEFSPARDVKHLADFAVKGRTLTAADLLTIAKTLAVGRIIRKHIVSADPDTFSTLHNLASPLKTSFAAEKEILRCIDEYGDVVDAADDALRNVRGGIRAATAEARTTLTELMNRHSDAIQDRLITSRYDRYVIPVKVSHKAKFRSCVIHDTSATGQTVYLEPAAVRSINDRLKQFVSKEKAIIHAILRKLSLEVVAPVASDIAALCGVIATLDAAAARAHASDSLHAVDVIFSESSSLNLPAARHPLLMWATVDAAMGANYGSRSNGIETGESMSPWKGRVVPSTYAPPQGVRCVCVTGPNTGGKTLSLKTLGVCALMARAGLFIPSDIPPSLEALLSDFSSSKRVDEAHVTIPYFDKVLADIGDDQSLVQSLSTFSGHVRRIKRILGASTSQSLVLLDEIGSGTVS